MRPRAKALRALAPYLGAAVAGACLQLFSSGFHFPGSFDLGFFLFLFVMAASRNLDSVKNLEFVIFVLLVVTYSAPEDPGSSDPRPEDAQPEQSVQPEQSAYEIRDRERGAGL